MLFYWMKGDGSLFVTLLPHFQKQCAHLICFPYTDFFLKKYGRKTYSNRHNKTISHSWIKKLWIDIMKSDPMHAYLLKMGRHHPGLKGLMKYCSDNYSWQLGLHKADPWVTTQVMTRTWGYKTLPVRCLWQCLFALLYNRPAIQYWHIDGSIRMRSSLMNATNGSHYIGQKYKTIYIVHLNK